MAKARAVSPVPPDFLRSFDQASGTPVAEVRPATPAEVQEAVRRAREAQPGWAALGTAGRVQALHELRGRMHRRMDEIVRTVMAETGKPQTEALSHDVLPGILTMSYLGWIAPRALRPQRVGRVAGPPFGFRSTIEWRPFGVVGVISPWNYPIFLSLMAVVPALLAGNAVVLKSSEVTPGCGEALRDLFGVLPDGVASVVQGAGEVGAALVDAPCDKICFIGSAATGRKIAAAASATLTPLVMELGGQDAAIVCEDADLDVTSSGILWGAFLNAGQTCCAIERVYVAESVAGDFEARLVRKLGQVREHAGAQIGPMSTDRQFEVVDRHVRDALDRGARLLAGGPDGGGPDRRGPGGNGSRWYPPTVVEGRAEDMAIFGEEIFGPVLPIVRVRDDEEAVRRANEEGFNLSASVWSGDARRARAIASRLRAGAVSINDHAASTGAPWGPWGGVGESGYGRLHGELGLREFAIPVHVAVSTMPGMKKLWWYPYDPETTQALRSVTDLLAAPGISKRAGALRSVASNALRAIRKKI
jgi:acyl-CoA reductase-like NAD-dependent aldehyde dehydrogenase